MESNTTTIALPLVFEKDGSVMTSSLNVAREFNKEHKIVIRSIKELLTSAQNCTDLFQETTYPDSYGRNQIMYLMNRDGFTLLAMGFTGERALEFKMKFLQAFSTMEKMLTSDDYILMRSQQILQERNKLLQQKVQMLEGRTSLLEQQNEILAPKAQYTDDVLQAGGTYTHSEMAKELNLRSWKVLVDELKRRGIMFKDQGGRYLLYADFSGKGYTTTRTNTFTYNGTTRTSVITVWTEQGRMFLHDKFKVPMQPIDAADVMPKELFA